MKAGGDRVPPALAKDLSHELSIITLAEIASEFHTPLPYLLDMDPRDISILRRWQGIKGKARNAEMERASKRRPNVRGR